MSADPTAPPPASPSHIIPTIRYRDAPAAIAWLCRAFGFHRHAVYEDGEGGIAHAQLVHGGGMLMLGSLRADEWGQRTVTPEQIGGRHTQACCVVVADADAHYAQAVAAGARILDAVCDQHYGGRGYSCLDLEGHAWWFGSYDPWQEASR